MKPVKCLLIICLTLILIGCQDKTELEDRVFAGAIAVDINEDGEFAAAAEMLSLPKEDGGKSEREVRKNTGETLMQAIIGLESKSPKTINYGLVKTCLLGERLLSDPERLRQVTDSLGRNPEFNGKMSVLAIKENAADALEKEETPGGSLSGYVTNMYENSKGLTVKSSGIGFEELCRSLSGKAGAVVGLLNTDGEQPELSGAAVISEGALTGFVSDGDLKGLAWSKEGKGAVTVCRMGGQDKERTAVLRADSSHVRYIFTESEDWVDCTIRVTVKGRLEEYTGAEEINPNTLNDLEALFSQEIASEIIRTHRVMANYGSDAFGLAERLRKAKPKLYNKYGPDLENIHLNVNARVSINNLGDFN